jgi:uncharacterized metal-binding protein YceD (DUF177 family)
MILQLDQIDKDHPMTGTLTAVGRKVPMECQEVTLPTMSLEYALETADCGFVLRYSLVGEAAAVCESCGGELRIPLAESRQVLLRGKPPTGGHQVLESNDLDTIFLEGSNLDLDSFLLEAVELALPSFPRHEDASQCSLPAELLEASRHEASQAGSPFQSLSSLLHQAGKPRA